MDETGEGAARRDRNNARVTAPGLRERKAAGEKIVVVTAYDFPSARLAERAGVDIVLVGDTVGIMALGYGTTVPVTMAAMLHHVAAVRPGLKRALLLADMPFGAYQITPEAAMQNAVLLMQAGAQAVKLEGESESIIKTTRRMTEAGIPVVGHLGLTPQSVNVFGGNRAQGREADAAARLRASARELEAAGAFGLVLEAIPGDLAAQISADLHIPTIGIGAGPGCDGQVQVWHDLMGIPPGKTFRHVKRYAEVGAIMEAALRQYADEVRRGEFPTKEHSLP